MQTVKHCATCTCEEHATATESKVLAYLRANPGRVLTRTEIVEHVWGTEFQPSIIEFYVHVLRKKYHLPIETVRGIGYRLGRLKQEMNRV